MCFMTPEEATTGSHGRCRFRPTRPRRMRGGGGDDAGRSHHRGRVAEKIVVLPPLIPYVRYSRQPSAESQLGSATADPVASSFTAVGAGNAAVLAERCVVAIMLPVVSPNDMNIVRSSFVTGDTT